MGLKVEEKIIVDFERAARIYLDKPIMAVGNGLACSQFIGGLACVSLALSYVDPDSKYQYRTYTKTCKIVLRGKPPPY